MPTLRNDGDVSPRRRWAARLESAAFAILLACLAGRACISEMAFRRSLVDVSQLIAQSLRGQETPVVSPVDRQEAARAGFSVVLFAAGALWLLAGAIAGRLTLRCWPVGVAILLFAAWSFVSAIRAADARSAWLAWAEQVSLLTAGFVTIQLCRSRRRFVLLAVVLTGVGILLAAKGAAQIAWEKPESLRFFQEHREEQLAAMGLRGDDPKAQAYAMRILDPAPTAYFGLANILAAALVVLLGGAAGLTSGKILYARFRRRRDGPLPRGQLRPATFAAGLTALALPLLLAVLLLTRSRGGIGAVFAVVVLIAMLWPIRRFLANRWRTAVWVFGMGAVVSIAAVAAYGLAKGRLPSKTLTVRWWYWTGSARIVRQNPWLGVGPGNFAQAYLRVRVPEAEEAVKTPHNVLAHAVTQFGLPGGVLYLVILVGFLVLAFRPALRAPPVSSGGRNMPGTLLLVVLAAGASRYVFGGADVSPAMVVMECLLPAGVLAVALAVARWFGGPIEDLPEESLRAIRLGLAAGAGAFVLHNLVSFGLWTPGVAMLFWLAVGAAAAQGGTGRDVVLRRGAIPLAFLGALAVVAAWIVLVLPVAKKLADTEDAARRFLRSDVRAAVRGMEQAAEADPQDAQAAMTAARFYLISQLDRTATREGLPKPMSWAREAIERNPDDAGAWRLAAEIARETDSPDAGRYWTQAVVLDPSNARLQLDYAAWLVSVGRNADADRQLDEAQRLDRRLRAFDPTSTYRFGPREQQTLRDLRANRTNR